MYNYIGQLPRGRELKAQRNLTSRGIESWAAKEANLDKRGRLREKVVMTGYGIISLEEQMSAIKYYEILQDRQHINGFAGQRDENDLPISVISDEELLALKNKCDEFGRFKREEPKIWQPTLGESVRIGEYIGIVDWVKKNAVRVKISLLGRETLVYSSVKRCVPVVKSEQQPSEPRGINTSNSGKSRARYWKSRRDRKRNRRISQ